MLVRSLFVGFLCNAGHKRGAYAGETWEDAVGDLANVMRRASAGAQRQVDGGVCWEARLEGTRIDRPPHRQSWCLLGRLGGLDEKVRGTASEIGHAQ